MLMSDFNRETEKNGPFPLEIFSRSRISSMPAANPIRTTQYFVTVAANHTMTQAGQPDILLAANPIRTT